MSPTDTIRSSCSNACSSALRCATPLPPRPRKYALALSTPIATMADHEAQHDTDSAHCQELRDAAQKIWDEKSAATEASKAAWDADQKDVAKQKSDEAKELAAKAEAAEANAANEIFKYMNASGRQPENAIDLHNLRVAEAERFVNQRLDADASSGAANLVIIYGAGNHSAGGKQMIKPAVIDILKQRGLDFKEDFDLNKDAENHGCVSITYKAGAAAASTPAEPAAEPAAAEPAAALVVEAAAPAAAPAATPAPAAVKAAPKEKKSACCIIM